MTDAAPETAIRKPDWLRKPPGSATETLAVKKLLRQTRLTTVCEEARCPNIADCFSRGTATFMILGDICTRGCRFCAVTTGKPRFAQENFAREAEGVAEAAATLGLKHVVVTSVARDDLKDGGASGFVATIRELRHRLPQSSVEVLIPDLRGNVEALVQIFTETPDVLNHNLETVPRLYKKVRPGAIYKQSLELLRHAAEFVPTDANGSSTNRMLVKTGIMLGLGESPDEVEQLMNDAFEHGARMFTAGQYLQPSKKHLPVTSYISDGEFQEYETMATRIGFHHVAVGPLVRSSYHADESFEVSSFR